MVDGTRRERAVALWAALAALVVGSAIAAAGSGEQESLAASERAFARSAAEQGVKAAFLAYLADDSVLFRPRAVPGKSWTRDHPAQPIRLAWSPAYVQVAHAGDLGYTTGPYELRSTDPKDDYLVDGRFATIWKRQPDGAWRVALDLGVATPAPAAGAGLAAVTEFGRPLAAMPAAASTDTAAADAGAAARDALLAADRAFGAAVAAEGAPAAYAAQLGEGAVLLREGETPVRGAAPIRARLAAHRLKLSWTPTDGAVSRSGDLGYVYGLATFAREAGGPSRDAAYLRVWERAAGGGWRIVLDLLSPLPPLPPETG